MPVLARPADDADRVGVEQQMVVRRRDRDRPVRQGLTVHGVCRGERPGSAENPREHARALGGDMEDDEDRGRQVGRQLTNQVAERLHPAR
jgi:hypothetical protein